MDALLTQRHVAQTVVEKEAIVMIVQENQPRLRADIALVALPRRRPSRTARTVMSAMDMWHVSRPVRPSRDWPGLAQVFELGRHVITQKRARNAEVVYGVTSLRPERRHRGVCWSWGEGSGN